MSQNAKLSNKDEERLSHLETKEQYNSYQEDLAFEKELNILRNDFYYKMIESQRRYLVDFMYRPLDVLSGDAYSLREIDESKTIYLLIDGMGKGLSASLSAMILASFINHIIDQMIKFDSFDIAILIHESINYMKPILLDEEAISIDFILIDTHEEIMEYAKFGMPVLLLETQENELITLKSNNPPLSKYNDTFNMSSYNIEHIDKFLFYSDGFAENTTKVEGKFYSEFLHESFLNSFTKEEIKRSFYEMIDEQEDDITLIFINRLEPEAQINITKSFDTTLDNVTTANDWYTAKLQEMTDDNKLIFASEVVFSELFMNAYEHGNLAIDAKEKHHLLNEDTYITKLLELQMSCDKKISVNIQKFHYMNSDYIATKITDEGKGFDTQILSSIFRNSYSFNGRGVFVSRKNSYGLFYNSTGNSVLYITKIH